MTIKKIFYIGEQFYFETSSFMSSMYTVDGLLRYDFGNMQNDLERGIKIEVIPAPDNIIAWAEEKLNSFKNNVFFNTVYKKIVSE